VFDKWTVFCYWSSAVCGRVTFSDWCAWIFRDFYFSCNCSFCNFKTYLGKRNWV